MMQAGLTGVYAEVGKRQKDRDPADVPESEKTPWKKKIKAWLASKDDKDSKALAAARQSRDPAFQAAWIDLVTAREIKGLA